MLTFFTTRKWFLWAYLGSAIIVALIISEILLARNINFWQQDVYNFLERKGGVSGENLDIVWEELKNRLLVLVFFLVMSIILLMRVIERATLAWREATSDHYFSIWPTIVASGISNASHRIEVDIRECINKLQDFFTHAARLLIALVLLLDVLRANSDKVRDVPYLDFPGSLAWVAFAIVLIGFVVSALIGQRMPGLNEKKQQYEGALRTSLVLSEENSKTANMLGIFRDRFKDIKRNTISLMNYHMLLGAWVHSYNAFVMYASIIYIGPLVYRGMIPMGDMVLVSTTILLIKGHASYFTDNWRGIAELLGVIKRICALEKAIRGERLFAWHSSRSCRFARAYLNCVFVAAAWMPCARKKREAL
ncbi:hypothetical protein L0Y49_01105 [bacterium]|nr:hypothetical protein [bacterium]